MTWKPPKALEDHNLYQLLEVENFCGVDQIRRAYRNLALRCHPDRVPNCAVSARKFVMGAQAYRVLNNEVLRPQYDRWLKARLKETLAFNNREWVIQRRKNVRGVYSRQRMVDSDYNRFIDECRENFLLFLNNVDRVKVRPRFYRQEAMEPGEYDALVEDGRNGFQNFLRELPRYRRHGR